MSSENGQSVAPSASRCYAAPSSACPFCGFSVLEVKRGPLRHSVISYRMFWVECKTCGCKGPECNVESAAVSYWESYRHCDLQGKLGERNEMTASRDAWREACRHLYAVIGEGGKHGRPMDLIGKTDYRLIVELICKAEAQEPESA